MFRLKDPLFLLLFLLLPLLVVLFRSFDKKGKSSIRFSDIGMMKNIKPSFRLVLGKKLIYVRILCLAFVILTLARPQSTLERTKINVEGIDIVLAVDISSSMLAMDFEMNGRRVNRLEVVKDVVEKFVDKRTNDRIGVVAFAGSAYTVCPLTLDHSWLARNLERVKIGTIEDGTAIGTAIISSLNRLKETETKEKIIILLTDGQNNAGKISPLTGAEASSVMGVRIYTIGAGTKGLVPYPVKDMFGNVSLQPVEINIDEDLLKEIAEITGGMYFRATDTESLNQIYSKIDKLEKTPMEEIGYNVYKEFFWVFLLMAMFLIILEILLSKTVFRRLP